MEHNLLSILSTRPLVLGLYIVVNLCLIIRRSNKFSTTSLKNWGRLSETISTSVPNRVKTRSYKNRIIFYFTKDFKAHTSANFVRYFVATIMNRCPLLVTSNNPIKFIPHFSKSPKGGMGCRGPFIVNLFI